MIKLVCVNHIVPCRDLNHPPHYGHALERLASAQTLAVRDQQHAQQLEREKSKSVQRELDLQERLEALKLSSGGNPSLDDMFNLFAESKTESSTAQTGAKGLPAAPRPVDPLESSPVQPVTPPARSVLDVLHEKIGEVLVCAGEVACGAFMVMKNVDSGGYVRVTLHDVRQWRTFFKHVVTNFLLPLAALDLVHDDLRRDCANLRCTRNNEAVTNVSVLDFDSLRPFDNGMICSTVRTGDTRCPKHVSISTVLLQHRR